MCPSFEYLEPATLAEAAALAAQDPGRAAFIAGGTDIVIQMRRGLRRPERVISLQRLAGLSGITVTPERIMLGALTTHRAIERHPAFQGALRGLIESAEVIGGHQVRNVGTVGGNLCNASPAADLLPLLLALEATVHLSDGAAERSIPLDAFLLGPGKTARAAHEVLAAVSFAPPAARSATAFIKQGRRRAMEISVASVAALVTLDAQGRCAEVRLAAGAVAPTAIRLTAAERQLAGEMPEGAALERAARAAAAEVAPLSDVRASATFRRHLVETVVPRAIRRCVARIEE
ncbi:MAG: FAD binding domain-containing protein [Variibacter sp.]|nr:FAD binding domain-containing protein [Variibacter sp.]